MSAIRGLNLSRMNRIARFALLAVAAASSLQQAAASFIDSSNVSDKIKGTNSSADVAIQDIIGRAVGFLGILAVIYGLWGGFLIMTAGGEEEKVKKGKSVLIQSGIGLVVIFLAYSIVAFVMGSLLGGN